MQQICSRSWRLRAIRKLSGPEVGLEEIRCQECRSRCRSPRSAFTANQWTLIDSVATSTFLATHETHSK